jgi:hypothetical protein
VCEEIECGWYCTKPTDCPKPICELMCEHPACETNTTDANVGGLPPSVTNNAIRQHTGPLSFILAFLAIFVKFHVEK